MSQQEGKRIYEVAFVFKKGEDPKVTHTLASSKEEAADNIIKKHGAAHIVEVFKV